MIQKIKTIATILSIAGLTFGTAPNALAASTSGDAEATLVKPLTLIATGAILNFGTIVSGPGGTVTVDPVTGDATVSGVDHLGGASQEVFQLDGEPGRTYDITVDPSVTLDGDTTAASMTATLDALSDSTSSSTGGTLDGTTGMDIVNVGGELTVDPGQTVDTYSGNFNITFNYN